MATLTCTFLQLMSGKCPGVPAPKKVPTLKPGVAPAPAAPFGTVTAPLPPVKIWGLNPAPAPAPAPAPDPAPAPAPDPAPAPTPIVPPVCGVNWDTATSEIEGVITQLKSCQNPNAALPAYVECPEGSTGGGTGSEPSYRAARARYFEAKEQAGVLCPYGTQQTDTSYYPTQTYSNSPYSSQAVQTQDVPEEIPLITPDGPIMGRGAKVGLGIGGVLLLAGGLWFMMGRNKRSRRA